MVDMFGDCALHSTSTLTKASRGGRPVEMENFFSRLALDIIGKAVFDYDFDSLTHDDPVIKVGLSTCPLCAYVYIHGRVPQLPLPQTGLPFFLGL